MIEIATHRPGLWLLTSICLAACSNGLVLDEVDFNGEIAAEDTGRDEPQAPEPEVIEGCASGCGIGEVCLESACVDLCEGVACPAPTPTCEDEAAVRHTGDGRCDPRTGECDFAAVRIATDCLAIGRVCQQDQCVVTCDGEGCAQPEDFCDGDVAVTYEGNGLCQPNNDCDFTQVETRTDCTLQNEICEGAACAFDPGARLMISEVLYNPPNNDRDREWVEIYNGTHALVDLSSHSLGAGGDGYHITVIQLRGALNPGECFLVGGPLQDEGNALPIYDQPESFKSGLQNHTTRIADGIALFDRPAREVGPDTIPIDALIYGEANESGLLDEAGQIGEVDISGADEGQSLERLGPDQWRAQPTPTPNNCNALR